MRRVIKFLRLPVSQQWRLVKILVLVVLVRLALWVMPFKKVRSLTAWMGKRKSSRPADGFWTPEQLAAAIEAVSRYVPAATCLTQALVAEVMLRRAGFDPVLRLGVGRGEQNNFEAHAWVELDGRVVIGKNEDFQRFTPLPPLGQPAGDSSGSPAEGVFR